MTIRAEILADCSVRTVVGYYGSKVQTAPKIVDLLPEHHGYVEPFCGGLAVLLAKPAARFEVVNDLDGDLMLFWRILRDQPVSEQTRARSSSWPITDEPDAADASQLRLEVRRCSRPTALDVIAAYGRDRHNLLYVDPPYLRETRNGTAYRHEMPDAAQHRELADALRACEATVVLSGYASPLYDEELFSDWDRFEISSGTGQGSVWQARTEVLWSNREMRRDATLDFEGTA